jgi:hypothetical protein
MGWLPKVNRHVLLYRQKTVGGETNYVKPVIATITNVDSATQLDLRIGRTGGTALNVLLRTDPDANTYPCWTSIA